MKICFHNFYRSSAGIYPKVWPVWRCRKCRKVIRGAKKPRFWRLIGKGQS